MFETFDPSTPTTATRVMQSDALAGWRSAPLTNDVDMIHRTITSFNSTTVMSWPTVYVNSAIAAHGLDRQADIDALRTVVNFQRKYINYQATYSAFLLGTLTESEFEAESDAYIAEERSVQPELLAPLVARLDRLLEFHLHDRELAEYLEVDQESMQQAVKLLGGRLALPGAAINVADVDLIPSSKD